MNKITNQWAIRDSGVIIFKDLVTYDIKAIVKTSKTFDLKTTATTVYARGGLGNPKLVSFKGSKETTVEATSALFDNSLLALQTGSDLAEGTFTIPVNSDSSVATLVGSNVTVTPAYTVKSNKFYSVVELGNNGLTIVRTFTLNPTATTSATLSANQYAVVSGKVILPTADNGITVGLYYDGTVTNAIQIENKSTNYAKELRCEVEVIVKDSNNGKEYSGLLIFPKVSLTDDVNLSLAQEGEPAVQNIGFEVLSIPGQDIQYQLVIFDKDNIDVEITA